jgi:hypothetical protein
MQDVSTQEGPNVRRSIDRRRAIPLAALALAAAVSAAVPAASAANVENPLGGPLVRELPFTLGKKGETECKSRELDKLVSLAGGRRYLLHLYFRDPRGKWQRAGGFPFDVKKDAKFRWADCIKHEDPGEWRHGDAPPKWKYSHVTVIDQHGVHAPPLVRKSQPIPDLGRGEYQVKSEIQNWGALPDDGSDRDRDVTPDKKKRPGKKKPPKPSPPPQGGGTSCRGPVPHRGKMVSFCPDWAPDGKIPVYRQPFKGAPIVDYIDPAGDDWYECQRERPGAPYELQGFRNTWWAYTLGDGMNQSHRKREGWVSETYFRGGGPNQPAANLRECTE